MRKAAKSIIILFVCISLVSPPMTAEAKGSGKVSILFIGNSITYSPPRSSNNHFIEYFKKLSSGAGRNTYIKRVTCGGKALKHFGNPKNCYGKKVMKTLKSRKWDYVVIQENTDYAVAKYGTMKKYAKNIVKTAKKKNPRVQIVYNASWTYAKTKNLFGKKYTQSKQQSLINSHYRALASATGGIISWSGNAFWTYRRTGGTASLYRKDKNHPTESGAFLSACSLYAAIFRESPEVSSYRPSKISSGVASQFKRLGAQASHI